MTTYNHVWRNYHSSNPNKGTDEEILSMYFDICTAIDWVKIIYGPDNLLLRVFYSDYNTLRSAVWARKLENKVTWE